MKRRELLGILGIAALSRPAAVWAQPSKKPRIGYLMDRSGPGPLEDGGLIALPMVHASRRFFVNALVRSRSCCEGRKWLMCPLSSRLSLS